MSDEEGGGERVSVRCGCLGESVESFDSRSQGGESLTQSLTEGNRSKHERERGVREGSGSRLKHNLKRKQAGSAESLAERREKPPC